MFALEWATYQRCFPALPPLSAWQWFNRRKCAYLLRDHAATTHLPLHCAFFSLQHLDLALLVKMNPAPAPDPELPARPLAGLLTAIARLLARRQPHNAPSLHTAWTIQPTVTEEYRILGVLNYELATHTRRLSLWCQQQLQQSPASLTVRKVLLEHAFGTSLLPWTPGPATWELRRGSSLVLAGFVSNWLR